MYNTWLIRSGAIGVEGQFNVQYIRILAVQFTVRINPSTVPAVKRNYANVKEKKTCFQATQ